jgi:hypothetical protein
MLSCEFIPLAFGTCTQVKQQSGVEKQIPAELNSVSLKEWSSDPLQLESDC